MAASVFNYEIEHFITPIRGLYKEYVISVDDLRVKNPEIFENKVVETDSIRDGYLIYELYGDGEEGEVIKEQVQTWICDNCLDVTRAVSTTLRAKEISFGNWFRMSEENRSPDELIVYCLSKMSKKHTVILNKSFAWSTLSNYISYSDVEIMQCSSVVLIYVGVSKYAILKPSWACTPPSPKTLPGTPAKATKRKPACKTTCRTAKKRPKKEQPTVLINKGALKGPHKARTLAERRLNQHEIGSELPSNTRVTRKKQVDYYKLNDGLDETPEEPTSPKPRKKQSYLPSRSGPSSTRQRAQ